MVAESWFRSLWRTQRKHEDGPEVFIGVLAFEVASLMSKLVHLWKSLSDKQVARLREEITNSVGVRKLVSDDDDYIVRLIYTEMVENLCYVARAVARFAHKCSDSSLKSFEPVFNDLIKFGADPYAWQFTSRKMDSKAKKMEWFISVNGNLYQEMESLSELEHSLRRMKVNYSNDSDSTTWVEYEKKVAWKQQEVKRLKEISLWNRRYDYVVSLLARSLFTIYYKIYHVFGISHMVDMEIKDSGVLNSDYIHHRSQSVSTLMQSSVYPSETSVPRFSSGPLENLITYSGPITRTSRTNHFYSGPLGKSITRSSPISERNEAVFYSGPLRRSTMKSGPLPKMKKTALNLWHSRDISSILQGKRPHSKTIRLTQLGPFKGCMMGGNSSIKNCHIVSTNVQSGNLHDNKDAAGGLSAYSMLHDDQSVIKFKHKLLNAPPETLGAAALALHYANVIIVIEKLVASPHLISCDARDDLYNMLPASVRAALREKLQPYAKSLTSSVYDTVLAGEWNEAISGILEWLAPLAHNTIRWQSERSFEHQNLVSRTNVLLVQTLYFANQEKTEASITELLIGLNYIWRFGREIHAKALLECASDRICEKSFDLDG
ncbi:hypothetical protein NMG60_11020269 [Bertholletia excelsa]